MTRWFLLVAALAFAIVSGANDGATLAATSSRSRAFSPLVSIAILTTAVASVPLLFGAGVATTLAHGLVSFQVSGGQVAFLAAVASALGVVFFLAWRGRPTSLTLALTGGIVGVGLGAHLATRWATVIDVLGAGLAGPLLSAAVAFVLAPRIRRLLATGAVRERRARLFERVGFVIQSLAYGANDAAKLAALLAVASAANVNPVHAQVIGQLVLGVCFALGALLAIRRIAALVGEQITRARHDATVSAIFGASISVLGGAIGGMPLSSTQATASALVGSSARLGPWRVRWNEVRVLATAWTLTLPMSVGLGAALGLILQRQW